MSFQAIAIGSQQLVAPYRLDIPVKTEKIHPIDNLMDLMECAMKVLLVALTILFSAAILLVAGFQLIRLFVTEVAEFVLEAWRRPELPSAH